MAREANPSPPPVLLVADAVIAGTIRSAVGEDIAWTVTDDASRARSLVATGGFVAVFVVAGFSGAIPKAVMIDPTQPGSIADTVRTAIASPSIPVRGDEIAALAYEEYIELARYATTRRYLIALMHRHGGSVTDAARNADMKRESLHRLLRRHHLIADNFREG